MAKQAEKEITLRDLLVVYRRRRSIIYGVTGLVLALAVLYCVVATRRYQAVGVLQVQKESSDALGLDSLMSGAGDDIGGGALDVNINLQTQAGILGSDTLALRTIDELHLENTRDFKEKASPIGWLASLIYPEPNDPPNSSLENAPKRRRRVLKRFGDNLDVSPVTGTRMIQISYSDPDPKIAAAVVSKLMQLLSDFNFQTRYDATNQASKWLGGQLVDLRKQSEDLQAKVVEMERQSGVYSLGITDQKGQEVAYSGILDQLQQTTAAMTAAQQNRILKGALAKAADSGDAEMLSGLMGSSSGPAMSNSLALIQSLRQQEAGQQAALREAQAKFGPSYSKIGELKAAIAGTDQSIQDEVARIRGRADNDYSIAKKAEDDVRQAYEENKKKADQMNDKAIEYTILRQEAEESRQLYEQLLQHLQQAGVLEGLKSSNITIVDPGRPASRFSQPKIPLFLGLGLGGGFLLGCFSAMVADTLDNKLHNVADVEDLIGQPVLGVTPQFERTKELDVSVPTGAITLHEPQSTYAEALRAIRTAIMLSRGNQPPKVILVTSSIAHEGKSTLSSNLAVIFAMQGQRVLVVDADLRKGTLANHLNLRRGVGLAALLAGQVKEPPILQVPSVPNLYAIVAGSAVPPNPSELLGTESMKHWISVWREEYDLVLLDGAPVLPVTDAVMIQPLVDVTILLSRSKLTERQQLDRSFHLLSRNTDHYVGVLLNGIDPHDRSYYGYYGYYGYREHAYGEKDGGDEN